MIIDRKDFICNIPIKDVRDFFRIICWLDKFEVELFVRKKICNTNANAAALVAELKARGLIENYENGYRVTIKGYALAQAKLLNPISRQRALDILKELLGRCKMVNTKGGFAFEIVYLGLFGSLSRDAEYVNDIDLEIEIELVKGKKRIWYEEIMKEENKVLRFLKNRIPYISLHYSVQLPTSIISIEVFLQQKYHF